MYFLRDPEWRFTSVELVIPNLMACGDDIIRPLLNFKGGIIRWTYNNFQSQSLLIKGYLGGRSVRLIYAKIDLSYERLHMATGA